MLSLKPAGAIVPQNLCCRPPSFVFQMMKWGLLVACNVYGDQGPLKAENPSYSSWRRHVIDDQSVGADGIKMADWNHDGLADWVTGWEEGGKIRIYTHPGTKDVRNLKKWPTLTVGKVADPEDAVFIDFNQDGALDVLSSSEGKEQALHVHWAPSHSKADYLNPGLWRTEKIPFSMKNSLWMFCEPAQVDGRNGVDFFSGSKEKNAKVGWWQSPEDPRSLKDWRFYPIQNAGWIMSLVVEDIDHDGDLDCWVTDRKGPAKGVYWIENPGEAMTENPDNWRRHDLGGSDLEVMFLDRSDLDRDGMVDTLVATRNGKWIWFKAAGYSADGKPKFKELRFANPYELPHGKAIHAADLNQDGIMDLVFTSNTEGDRSKPGVHALIGQPIAEVSPENWKAISISGSSGIKFDLVRSVDIDGDGDLDLVTCEERDNLGVFWYENEL
jgi:hypothetical protein